VFTISANVTSEDTKMATLYEDRHVTCEDDSLTIHNYYFPFRADKRIPYAAIRGAIDRKMGPLTGQWRIWGMGLGPYWFHLDTDRPRKDRAIALDLGGIIRPVVTPDDVDAVLAVLRERTVVS
jgi:hypothetical protein